MKTAYEITNIGTPAFPQFEVRLNTIDDEGFELEHLSEVIGSRPSYSDAMTLQWQHEHGKL